MLEGNPSAIAVVALHRLRYTSAQDVPPAKAGSFVGDPVGLLPTTIDNRIIGPHIDPESSFVKAVPKALLGFWVPAL